MPPGTAMLVHIQHLTVAELCHLRFCSRKAGSGHHFEEEYQKLGPLPCYKIFGSCKGVERLGLPRGNVPSH